MSDLSAELTAVLAALEQRIEFEALPPNIGRYLKARKIRTYYDLSQYRESTIAMWPGFGPVTMSKIRMMVEEQGLHLGMDIPEIQATAKMKR